MRDAMELIEDQEQRAVMARAFIKQDQLDAVQLLSDLKYLDAKAFDSDSASSDELKAAIHQFRIECRSALASPSIFSNFRALWAKADVQTESQSKLSQSELLLLKQMTGLEGELVFKAIPVKVDVCYRVALYRFSVYGLSKISPNADKLSQQLNTLSGIVDQFKHEKGLVDFLNVLGNQKKVSEFCESSRFTTEGFIGPIFFFNVKKAKQFYKLTGDKIKLNKSKDFLDVVSATSVKTTLQKVLKSPGSKDQIKSYITYTSENKFMLRVLQVKLWVLGLYQGKLDYDFGIESVEALKQLLDLVFKQSDEEELKNILFVANSSQCVVNFQYLLDKHIKPLEAKGSDLALDNYYELIEGEYGQHENEEVRDEAVKLNQTIEDSLLNHAKALHTLKQPKRMYKGKGGFRKFLSRAFKLLKNAAKKIVAFIQKLIKLMGKVVKFIFEEIKEAFLTFKRGLVFLFGKRKVKVDSALYSDYDFDFDGHTLLVQSVSAGQLTSHTQEVQLRAQALYPTIRFVTEVIKWGANLSTPMGWVNVLIKMASMLKDLIRGKLKD